MTATIEPDILDFFAGPGGWDRGAELAGIDPRRIVGYELDPAAGPGSSCRPPTSWPRRWPPRCWRRSRSQALPSPPRHL